MLLGLKSSPSGLTAVSSRTATSGGYRLGFPKSGPATGEGTEVNCLGPVCNLSIELIRHNGERISYGIRGLFLVFVIVGHELVLVIGQPSLSQIEILVCGSFLLNTPLEQTNLGCSSSFHICIRQHSRY